MNIPREIRQADTVVWSDSLSDYPAPTWTLKYLVRGPSSLSITASPSGSDHSFVLSSDESAKLTAGRYKWQAVVTNNGDRFTVGDGELVVQASLDSVAQTYEARSPARTVMENLERIMRQRSTEGFESVTIGGRSVTKMSWSEIIRAYNYAKEQVKAEEQAEKIAAGEGGKKIQTRFVPWA